MKNILAESIISRVQKTLGDKSLPQEEGKAVVIRGKKRITIVPKKNEEYTPCFIINNIDSFEDSLEEYLKAVKNADIKCTRMDKRHSGKYFLFNVWKNATIRDFLEPEDFIRRYTDFILDDTFSKYDKETSLGQFEGNSVLVQRKQDDYGFETPYIMHIALKKDNSIYNLPWIRYGIAKNEQGERIAYIYAVQRVERSSDCEYSNKIKKELNRVNGGVKKYRNITPNALVALSIFIGMLSEEGIKEIRVPDFLIGRYGRFSGVTSQEECDRIQSNITNKFMRNFLRLSEEFDGFNIDTAIGNGIDSFLYISLEQELSTNNPVLSVMYDLGRCSTKTDRLVGDLDER